MPQDEPGGREVGDVDGRRPPADQVGHDTPGDGTEQQAVRAVPAGHVDVVGAGEVPITGRSSSLTGRSPTRTSRKVASVRPGLRRSPSENRRRRPPAVGSHVEAHVLDRRAERESSVTERHHVMAANRLQHGPRPGLRIELEVHDLPPHRTHARPHPEPARDLGGPRARPRSRPRRS